MRKGEAPLDAWSIVHVASGAALAYVGVPFGWMLLALIAFEVFEWWLRGDGSGSGLLEHESPKNIAADVAVGVLGFLIVGAAL